VGVSVTTIRAMLASDIEEVAELEAAWQPRPWSEAVFRDELQAEGRRYLVASGARLEGFGGVMVVDDESHVTNLLVAPERRRHGLGRRLMVGLIAASLDAGARHVTLEVRSGNHPARALYTGLGLRPVGVRPGYYGDDDALIMWAHDIDDPAFLEGLA